MKIILAVCIFLAPVFAATGQADISSLVEAERAFARHSVKFGVREAFVTYFADDGIAFLPDPVNGKAAYGGLQKPAGDSAVTLDWAPVYGDISQSGDLGYSTGPAVYSDSADRKRPTRHSLFFSIWKRQPGGEWRVALDLGIGLDSPAAPLDAPYRRAPQWKARAVREDHPASLEAAEKAFLAAAPGGKAWREFLREDARVYRNGRMPLTGREWIGEAPTTLKGMTGEPIGSGVSAAGDLGYAYGRYSTTNGEKGYYVHAWKRDESGRWRIVFEVSKPLAGGK